MCNTKEYASCLYCVGKAGTDVYTICHLQYWRSEEVIQHGGYTLAFSLILDNFQTKI